ncbi:5-carboxymethyl-2-hydroxymuconate isomerase [Anaerobacillus arseniciselenatis]|uniref:5-carboxymethyl-2-hydroxymuconate isomerase n=1 Tax=Anaerobacillus arseniciselenatis TaxID=85682 RepID=A0A1S2L875_9BACI|nr:fumarylacetoacetate hydrolase family protein [Anaerobacillus arseniciselenatis]OIJ08203.1 5-carboxymethyl-2-hydroxymuconate isomerase [Anaerobacillus arseniciselenatis]
MQLVNFYRDERLCLGIKTEKGILDVEKISNNLLVTTDALITQNALKSLMQSLDGISDCGLYLKESELTLGPCISKPEKIICVGLNYRKHADECGMEHPTEPILFSKFNNSLTGTESEIKIPSNSTEVDYEVELAIVIGKEAKDINPEEVDEYIFGYCVANDVSARDLQFRSPQWLIGKSCDGFCPIGPYLVTKDEIEDPNNLNIKTWLNGKLKQNSNTSDMIFNCQEAISYASKHMTLKPGDIILTGTPEGVIAGDPEKKRVWIKPEDKVTVEIEKLGQLTNYFVKG